MANNHDDFEEELQKLNETTPDQRVFAITYANTHSVSQACIKLGIPITTGYQWLSHGGVKSLIVAIQEEQEHTTIVTQRMIEGLWLEALPKLMGEEEVPYIDKEGTQMYGKKFYDASLITLLKEMRNHVAGGDGSLVALPKNVNFIVQAPDE